MKIRRIKKRDGREVPFDKSKISDAVGRAQSAVGASDPHFAAEVAEVVEMALARRFPGSASGRAHAGGDEPIPGIEDIQDLVEQALIELGHAPVAKAYILYRDRRARLRGALQVRASDDERATPAPRATQGDARSASDTRSSNEARSSNDARSAGDASSADAKKRALPRVEVSGGVTAWSKGRIVVALMNEAELPRATAELVASRVEERVFDSGLKRISTGLVRELVDNELVELGLAQALRRQRPLVVPRHDLREALGDPAHAFGASRAAEQAESLAAGVAGREPTFVGAGARGRASRDAGAALSASLLARWALEDLLPERTAELARSGDLAFEGLEAPHMALVQAVPCELLVRDEHSSQAPFELLDELASLLERSSYGVVLEDAETLVQALVRGRAPGAEKRSSARTGAAALASFLLATSAIARASGRAIDLVLGPASAPATPRERAEPFRERAAQPSTRALPPAWLVRLVETLAELAAGGDRRHLPRVFVDGQDLAAFGRVEGGESAAAAHALDRLLAEGLVVPTWSVAGERFAAPGLVRGWRERGALVCGGACAINLARAARRAGPWREDALLENAAAMIESALDGLAALHEHQRRERWLENAARGSVRGRVSYAITAVGLREALRVVADGELRPEQGARLYAFLAEAVQRFSKQRGLSTTLTAYFGERAARSFAARDREHFSVSQPLLFDSTGASAERAPAQAPCPPYSTGLDLSPAGAHGAAASVLEAAEAALLATQKCGAVHPPQILRALAAPDASERARSAVRQIVAPEAPAPAWTAWERLERARARLRSGAWALYALPSASEAGGGADTQLPLELPEGLAGPLPGARADAGDADLDAAWPITAATAAPSREDS